MDCPKYSLSIIMLLTDWQLFLLLHSSKKNGSTSRSSVLQFISVLKAYFQFQNGKYSQEYPVRINLQINMCINFFGNFVDQQGLKNVYCIVPNFIHT